MPVPASPAGWSNGTLTVRCVVGSLPHTPLTFRHCTVDSGHCKDDTICTYTHTHTHTHRTHTHTHTAHTHTHTHTHHTHTHTTHTHTQEVNEVCTSNMPEHCIGKCGAYVPAPPPPALLEQCGPGPSGAVCAQTQTTALWTLLASPAVQPTRPQCSPLLHATGTEGRTVCSG